MLFILTAREITLNDIAVLRQKLALCETKLSTKLAQKLTQISQRQKQGKPVDKMLEQVSSQIEGSTQRIAQREASIGKVDLADLPVSQHSEKIAKTIADNQVVIIAGETGSGKTTQLPKICLQLGLGIKGLIGHTQPRRLAARTVATRIAQELGTNLGDKVGYQVRFTEQVTDASMIKLMTDGILLAETQHDPLLEKYEVIIIDEAHERSLNIDFLLGYLKRILTKRTDLKLIITSATIDLDRFSEHFNKAPIIEVSGRTFPVEVLYRPLVVQNQLADESTKKELTQIEGVLGAVSEIIELHKNKGNSGPRDILIFFSGEREIRETAEALRKAQLRHCEVMPLYARLSVKEQNKIFQTNGQSVGRRIILATNVAETSVTVPGIGFVIDTGVARISRYSYRSKVQRLPIESISQASANQRAGRCGRIAPGVCIRLFSEDDFSARAEFTDAEIRRTNLAAVILQMLSLKLGDIAKFPFIDPPDSRFITDGFKLLEELGAVNKHKKMSALGHQLSKLPVDPRIGRMIIEANRQGSLKEVLIIASALSVQDPRERPIDKQQAADQAHKVHQDEDSDFVSFVNLWNVFEEQRQELSSNQLRKYCTKNFLSFMRMREWRDVHRQLHLACKALQYESLSTDASYESVHIALLSGLLSHVGFKQENKEFLGARNRRFYIFPASTQYKKPAKWLMVSELVETSKLFGRVAAKIEPHWIEPLAQHLIKKSYHEPKWQKKRAQVSAFEQVVMYGLIIIQKRSVNYGSIDPVVSQQIFIRSALVEGHYYTKGPFYKHNQQLLDHVELLEAKSRRRDLLVDEDTLHDFYAQRFASLSDKPIVNGAGFEKWRKKIEKNDPKILFLQEQDILQRSSDHVRASDYPDSLSFKGVELALSYHFNPVSEDDGVSLHLPVALLKQFNRDRLDWLVPGLLKERCVGLLKSLPKSLRKNFVPIPDYVDAFIEGMNFGHGNLIEQMSHHLLRMTGVQLKEADFDPAALAQHLHFNIKLIGNQSTPIEQSRNIDYLADKHSKLIDSELQEQAEDVWGDSGLTSWTFDKLPESVEVQQGGIKVLAWPALKLKKDKVDLILTMDQAFARRTSIIAIAYFARLALSSATKKARNSVPLLTESTLFAGKIFTKSNLEYEINSFAMREAMRLEESLPRTQADYRRRLDDVKKGDQFSLWVKKIAEQVHRLHRQYHALQKQLNGAQQLATITIVSDMKGQLDRLFNRNYLTYMSWQRLGQYTRYMNSLEIRVEKYQRELPRQKMLTAQLEVLDQRLLERVKVNEEKEQFDPRLEAYKWLLEEYRISLFSQQIKTLETVSEKRMQQKWREISE